MKLVLGGVVDNTNICINDSFGSEQKSALPILSASNSLVGSKKVSPDLEQKDVAEKNEVQGLYTDIHTPSLSSSKSMKAREYSTLRAKPRKRSCSSTRRSNNTSTQEEMEMQPSSAVRTYYLWYMQMVECSLRKVLQWLDEHFDEERDNETISQQLNCAKSKRQ